MSLTAMLIVVKCLLTSKSSAVSALKPPVTTATLLNIAMALDCGQAHLGTSLDVFAAAMPQLSEQAEHPRRSFYAEMRHLNVKVNVSLISHDFSHRLMFVQALQVGTVCASVLQ